MDQSKTTLEYSTKNIPVHSRREYKLALINSFQKLAHRLSWKAWHFLHPNENPDLKENFGLTSTSAAPFVPELQSFYNKIIDMMRDVEHKKFSNPLQVQLKNDRQEIAQSNNLLIEADKTRNFYSIDKSDYDEMIKKEINKSYKKATQDDLEKANSEQVKIVEDLNLTDRNIFKTSKQEANIKLKDHKETFNSNPTTRLINPSKPETGKISKKILSRIVYELRVKTKYQQWKNTDSVISWFKKIPNKENSSFITFDINDFYNSISEGLLSEALVWAISKTSISKQEEEIILKTKKSFLFYDRTAYKKKGGTFNVAMGSYDGAETCELVGLFLLHKVN